MTQHCPFCSIRMEMILHSSEVGIAIPDFYPVSQGHTLVIPRRHVASLYALSDVDQAALWRLTAEVRQQLIEQYHPDGFNIGINDGSTAGQTIAHAHIHIIPRRSGDVRDPRGGVRWVIPDKAAYWEAPS